MRTWPGRHALFLTDGVPTAGDPEVARELRALHLAGVRVRPLPFGAQKQRKVSREVFFSRGVSPLVAANQARKPGTTVGGNRPSAFDKMYMFCLVASGMSTELSEKNDACVTVG